MESRFEIDPTVLQEDGEVAIDVEIQRAMMSEFENIRLAELEERRFEELTGQSQNFVVSSTAARGFTLGSSRLTINQTSLSSTAASTRLDDVEETTHGISSSRNFNQEPEARLSVSPDGRQSRGSSAGSVEHNSVSDYDTCDDSDAADRASNSSAAARAASDSDDDDGIFAIDEEKRRWKAACEEFYKYTSKPIAVNAEDKMFRQIVEDFTKNDLTVIEVYKVCNSITQENFDLEAEKLARQNPELSNDLNVKWLYHGSNAPLKELCDEGLDNRLSRKGRFGKGTYFSDQPAKCVNYSAVDETRNRKYILYCRVILGCVKEYEPGAENRSLVRPPKKGVVNNNTVYYNSVKGKPRDYTEYVIYESRQAYIEYFIFFRSNNSSSVPLSRSVTSSSQNDGDEVNTTEIWLQRAQIAASERPSDRRKKKSSDRSFHQSDTPPPASALPTDKRPSAQRRSRCSDRNPSALAGQSEGQKRERSTENVSGGRASSSSAASASESLSPTHFNDVVQSESTRLEGYIEQLQPTPLEQDSPATSTLQSTVQDQLTRRSSPSAADAGDATDGMHDATDGMHDATDGMHDTPQMPAATARMEVSRATANEPSDEPMSLEAVTADRDLIALLDISISEFMTYTNIEDYELARDYVLRTRLDSQTAIFLFFKENY